MFWCGGRVSGKECIYSSPALVALTAAPSFGVCGSSSIAGVDNNRCWPTVANAVGPVGESIEFVVGGGTSEVPVSG